VSNFLRGLVQRGAGLPLPVTMRPAASPPQLAGLGSISHEESEANPDSTAAASLLRDEYSLAREVPKTDLAERRDSTPPRVAVTLPEPRSAIQGPQTLQPAAPQSMTVSPKRSAEESQPRPRVGENTQPQELSVATPTSTGTLEGIAASSRSTQESRPTDQPSQRRPEPRTMHQDATANSLPARLSPKQEHFPVVRLPQPASAAPRIAEKKTAPESRNIQVKIGRVEIRSSQPATVVRPTRPQNPGGFSDWKLARTYLDRSLR